MEFSNFHKSEGVRHELTVPKSPEQKGVAEQLNRTLVEMTRSMLTRSIVPQKLWAEAMSTAVYLRNQSPTKAVEGMTPHEAFHGNKPNVKHLRVFGCVAFAHIAKDERKKLDIIARRCVLVGYGTEVKGYRLYDPDRNKMLYSRDVKFNEEEFGIKKECAIVEPVKVVEIGNNTVSDSDVVRGDATTTIPALRRSDRIRCRPDYYAEGAIIASNSTFDEPRLFQEAMSSPIKTQWETAMELEMKSLSDNEVWKLIE